MKQGRIETIKKTKTKNNKPYAWVKIEGEEKDIACWEIRDAKEGDTIEYEVTENNGFLNLNIQAIKPRQMSTSNPSQTVGDEARQRGFALSYAKDIACALIAAGHREAVDTDTILSTAFKLEQYLLTGRIPKEAAPEEYTGPEPF